MIYHLGSIHGLIDVWMPYHLEGARDIHNRVDHHGVEHNNEHGYSVVFLWVWKLHHTVHSEGRSQNAARKDSSNNQGQFWVAQYQQVW